MKEHFLIESPYPQKGYMLVCFMERNVFPQIKRWDYEPTKEEIKLQLVMWRLGDGITDYSNPFT